MALRRKSHQQPRQSSDPRREAAVLCVTSELGFDDRMTMNDARLRTLAESLSSEQLDRLLGHLQEPAMDEYRGYLGSESQRLAVAAKAICDRLIGLRTLSYPEASSQLGGLAAQHQVLLDSSVDRYREIAAGDLDPADLVLSIHEAQERLRPEANS